MTFQNQIAPALLTIKEFAVWSRLGRTKIYELIGSEELRAIKIGRRTYISVEAAEDWLAAQPAFESQLTSWIKWQRRAA